MLTLAGGLRLTLRPHWPWKPAYKGWLSFFFVHVFGYIGFSTNKRVEEVIAAAEARRLSRNMVVDPTKRKTLQPGKKPMAKGWREPDPVDKVSTSKLTKTTMAVSKLRAKYVQPGFRKNEHHVIRDGETFTHSFSGSTLSVGNVTLARSLAPGEHTMEITPRGDFYIDNKPYKVNPTDLFRARDELRKAQVAT